MQKRLAIDGAKDGAAKYGPVGAAWGLVTGSFGMAEGLGKAIKDNYEYDVEKGLLEQRQNVNGDYFSQMKSKNKR
ncbi:hypothetical protein [Desulfovibrio sp. JC010]|uniref:hypothetical protein n=1 Tax=Desulfovibrio sp. JC010 TaxID=2593641 RepID=UPI0013D27C73|nr:hypothetical protein [Desulfovibrio sp. JC010]NDV28465.1 hypothetical protein [Desulfovibrio sp. JC010]